MSPLLKFFKTCFFALRLPPGFFFCHKMQVNVHSATDEVHRRGLDSPASPATRIGQLSLSEKPGAVTCGGMHNIAITEPSGNLISWGYGGDGALGYGDVWDRAEPVQIGSIHSVAEVACGYRHTLAVRGNLTEGATTQFGELWAWGLNAYGELGLGDDNARRRGAGERSGGASLSQPPLKFVGG